MRTMHSWVLTWAALAVAANANGQALDAPGGAHVYAFRDDLTSAVTRCTADNPVHELRFAFSEGGLELGSMQAPAPGPLLTMQLREWGFAGSLQLAGPATPEPDASRLQYRRGALTEWYVNGPAGLEQGFTVEAPPAGDASAPLALRMVLGGKLAVRLHASGKGLTFHDDAGAVRLRYWGLAAWDAAGRELEAWLELSPGVLSILVAADGASYPLTVDPLIATEQARLTAYDIQANGLFGYSVAVSGNTAVVGSPSHFQGNAFAAGRAYVFVRDSAASPAWHLQGLLTPANPKVNEFFGISVAVWGDTVLVGANKDDAAGPGSSGSVYVFVRSGTSWTQQAQLFATDATGFDELGDSVSLWGDTAVAGAGNASGTGGADTGAAYVFVRSGTTWSQQAKLTAAVGTAGDAFGSAVAVFANTVVVGAPADSAAGGVGSGSACVFVRSGTTWSQQAQLFASDPGAQDYFGTSVAVSGETAVVGAPGNDAAYIFFRSGTSWSQQQKLAVADPLVDDFGHSVSIENNTAVIGSPWDDHSSLPSPGAAYVFFRSGTSWSQQAKLIASNPAAGQRFGWSVSVVGNRAYVGVPYDTGSGVFQAGAAHAFFRSGTSWSEEDRVTASNVEPSASFGGSIGGEATGGAVAISGDTALVGAPNEDQGAVSGAGAAWVYVRDGATWKVQARLTAGDATAAQALGDQVALSGDTALVAAPGSAYIFVRTGTTWSLQQKLAVGSTSVALSGDTAVFGNYWADGTDGDATVFVRSGTTWTEQDPSLQPAGLAFTAWFGYSVAIDGDTIVVGAKYDNGSASESGSAWIFVRNGTTWAQQGPEFVPAVDGTKAFGSAVAISGDTVLVGADQAFSTGGAAYVFVRNGTTWSQQGPKLLPTAGEGGSCGCSVAIFGGLAIVGCKGSILDLGGAGTVPGVGAAFAYARAGQTWNLVKKLTASDADTLSTPVQSFGASVAIADAYVIAGAPGTDVDDGADLAASAGAAYAYLLQTDWQNLGGGVSGSNGPLTFVGSGPLVEGTMVTSTLTGAKPNSVATHVVGLSLLNAPFKGGTWGPALNALIPGFPTGPAGSIVLSAPWPAGIPSGTTIYAQWWMADAGAVHGVAGSNTIAGTVP